MFGHISRGGECSKAQKARRALASGMGMADVARNLGVSVQNVSDAMKRRSRIVDAPLRIRAQIEEHW